ncbi:hypothetical protein [Microbaculum sp. FT89]|uniref:hypothetical protein n=1 Tax=Microbaculum sp. FT89 TaxID=3447298 RepID=UPI003F53BB26
MYAVTCSTGRLGKLCAGLSPAVLFTALSFGAPQTAVAAEVKLDCAPKPASCGYPGNRNTGLKKKIVRKRRDGRRIVRRVRFKTIPDQVRSGPGWHWDSRGFVQINGDKTVFRNFIVKGTVDVLGDNVLIQNVRVLVGGESFGIAIRRADNTRIKRCQIGPAKDARRLMVGIKDIYGDAQNTTISRCNIYGTSTGIQMGRGRIIRNFIHDLRYESGDHLNGITSNGSSGHLLVKRNTIFNPHDQTDAIGLFQDFGIEANRTIVGNLVAGGGYTVYGGEGSGDRSSYNIKITNNRFSNIFYSRSGYYGHGTAFNRRGSGNVWSGNFWDHTGGTVPVP